MNRFIQTKNLREMKKQLPFLILAFILIIAGTVAQAQQSFILNVQGHTMSFTNAQRTVIVNTGNSGTNAGSKHKYANVITKDGIVVYAIMTIKERVNINVTNFDDDAITGEETRFQPRLGSSSSSGGYIVYELEFFNTANDAPVYLYNYNITGIDIDGQSSLREYVEAGGFTSYTVNNPTGLTISTNNTTGRTRFLGISTSLPGVTFDNSAAFIANYTNPNNKISFALGLTGSVTERFFSVQIGVAGGVFTTPNVTPNPLPLAVDDVGTPVQSNTGGVAVQNVLSNDVFNGNPITISQVNLTLSTPPSHAGITLNTSTGQVNVAPGTPGGIYTFVYQICMKNAPNNCDIATVTVKVLAADLAITKTANPNPISSGQQLTFTITVTNNGPTEAANVIVNDVLNNAFTVQNVNPSTGSWSAPNWSVGTLNNGASATLTITGTANSTFYGNLPNTATVSSSTHDPVSNNNSAIVNVTVSAVPPTANPDNATTPFRTPVTLNVLSNDVAGTFPLVPSSVILVSGTTPPASHGDFTVNNTTGQITFTPAANFSGTTTVQYRICDQLNLCSTALVTVVVTPPVGPTAANDNASTPYNTPVTLEVLSNDQSGSTPILPSSVTLVSGTTPPASEGVFSVNNTTGQITFTPAVGFSGTSTVEYQVCDEVGLCDQALVIVTVGNATGPTAVNDQASTPFNTPVTLNILDNDIAGNSPLVPSSVAFVNGTTPPASEGVFTITGSGQVTFTPAAGFSGTSTIQYNVCDELTLCSQALITITVGDPSGPTANNDQANTAYNTPITVDVLANDTPGDSPLVPSSVQLVAGTTPPPSQGLFSVDPVTGQITFTPAPGFSGPATVQYKVCDQNNLCSQATLAVVVGSATGPTANDDNASTEYNTPVTIAVLANDAAGSTPIVPTTVTLVTGTTPPATQGVFSVNTVTGEITFTPATGFSGNSTVKYQVCDQNNLCDDALVTVTVGAPTGPTAVNDFATTLANNPVTINVTNNDMPGSEPIDQTTVTLIPGTGPNPATQGVFSVHTPSGLVTFVPVLNFIGTVNIDYQVCDNNGLCDIATITVNVFEGAANLFPATGPGTLAFEDLWPGKGDYDFNDMVIDYQFEIIGNTSNMVEQLIGTFILKAFGASYENGFGFQLMGNVSPSDILSVQGFELTEGFINLNSNGVEADQSKPTFILFDNAFTQMPHPGIGIGVNTTPEAPYVTPKTFVLTITFKPNETAVNDLNIGNFNPFIIVNKVRSHEVHLPYYPPTDLANLSLFGQWEDASNPPTGKYYVTANNLPWAINIYESFDYPIEKQVILGAHLKFAAWAMSGGVQFPDWYKNLTGYRNSSLIYQVPQN